MNKLRRIALLVMGLALLTAIPASAQTGTFGLSAEDFDFFTGANANSATKTQYTFDYEVTLTVEGAGIPVDVLLSGTGALDADNEMFSITLDGSATVAGQSTPLEGELRIVGEELYARATDPTTDSDTGWFSLNLSDLSDVDLGPGDFGPELTDAFLEGFAEGAGVNATDFDPLAFQNMLAALGELNPEDFIFITRGKDLAEAGVFTIEFSIPALADAPGMDAVTRELLIASALDPDPANSFVAAFNAVLATAFENTSITVDQTIGLDDSLVQETTFSIISTVDPADFDSSGGPISTVFILDIQLSDYDTPAVVEAPAEALEIPSSVVTDALAEAGIETDGGGEAMVEGSGDLAAAGSATSVDLTCDSRALDYEGETGATFSGTCPANCVNGSLWGTDIYTDDSYICTAAIHAGAISTEGGDVTFVIQDGMDSYTSTEQNGITSAEWPSWGRSFSFETAASSASVAAPEGSVGINDSVVVSLPAGGTVQVPLAGSGTVTITAAGLEGADTVLRVLDASGNIIADNDDNGGVIDGLGTLDSAVVDVAVDAGTIIEIAEFGSAGGDVEITVTGTANESASAAPAPDSIGVGESAVLSLPAGGTVQIPLDASGTVTITASGLGGADTILRLLDANGNLLEENDDQSGNFPNLGGLDSAIENVAVKSGMVIEVGEFGSVGGNVEVTVIGEGSADASTDSGGDVAGITVDTELANEYTFSNGISFGYPAEYDILTESDVVTVVMAPSQRAYIQAYETNFLFSDMDMGIDFVKDNAGTTAASTWGFTYDASQYEEVTVNGRDMFVLEFEGTQNGEDVIGAVAVVTYASGGYGYVLSYALPPAPDTFVNDTLAVAASLDG